MEARERTPDRGLKRQTGASPRDRALRRAAIAVAAAVVLLVVVLVVEQGGHEAAAPLRPAGLRPVAPAADEAGAEAAPVAGGAAGGAVSAAPSPTSAADTAPEANPAAREPALASAGSASPASAAAAADNAVASALASPASAAPSQPDPASTSGYRIQLGVFDVPANAEGLQRELAAQGLPAHIQSRVVLGPYPTRAKAQAAQAALRKAGQAPGMLVPPRSR